MFDPRCVIAFISGLSSANIEVVVRSLSLLRDNYQSTCADHFSRSTSEFDLQGSARF